MCVYNNDQIQLVQCVTVVNKLNSAYAHSTWLLSIFTRGLRKERSSRICRSHCCISRRPSKHIGQKSSRIAFESTWSTATSAQITERRDCYFSHPKLQVFDEKDFLNFLVTQLSLPVQVSLHRAPLS